MGTVKKGDYNAENGVEVKKGSKKSRNLVSCEVWSRAPREEAQREAKLYFALKDAFGADGRAV